MSVCEICGVPIEESKRDVKIYVCKFVTPRICDFYVHIFLRAVRMVLFTVHTESPQTKTKESELRANEKVNFSYESVNIISNRYEMQT